MKKHLVYTVICISLILLVTAGWALLASKKDVPKLLSGQQAIVFKSPTCGCCGIYIEHLKHNGLVVEIKDVPDVTPIKDSSNIPQTVRSCHTTKIGDYFVEGHVPAEAIEKLMKEKPDIDGIAMPGMPSGSPGMHGAKIGDFVIYAVKDGQISEFMRL